MTYIPKRVFLLDCGKYIELSYEEFCEKKEETEGHDAKNRRYILVQGMLLEVDESAYREHYRICPPHALSDGNGTKGADPLF